MHPFLLFEVNIKKNEKWNGNMEKYGTIQYVVMAATSTNYNNKWFDIIVLSWLTGEIYNDKDSRMLNKKYKAATKQVLLKIMNQKIKQFFMSLIEAANFPGMH